MELGCEDRVISYEKGGDNIQDYNRSKILSKLRSNVN
jgi:hypothetical protein